MRPPEAADAPAEVSQLVKSAIALEIPVLRYFESRWGWAAILAPDLWVARRANVQFGSRPPSKVLQENTGGRIIAHLPKDSERKSVGHPHQNRTATTPIHHDFSGEIEYERQQPAIGLADLLQQNRRYL